MEPRCGCLRASETFLEVGDRVGPLALQIAPQGRTGVFLAGLYASVAAAYTIATEHHEIGADVVTRVLEHMVE